ncbi:hypothetical protein FB45DRAFT_748496, partial [Roridomyces roridus]
PRVADKVYEHLFNNFDAEATPPILPDLTQTAHALHLAVQKLREDPEVSFKRWAPFVHYGL